MCNISLTPIGISFSLAIQRGELALGVERVRGAAAVAAGIYGRKEGRVKRGEGRPNGSRPYAADDFGIAHKKSCRG